MAWWQQIGLVGLAGSVGAVLRYGVTRGVLVIAPKDYQFLGTLVVNVTGCFLLAVIVTWLRDKIGADAFRLALTVGFAGAYTTFSTFAVELFDLQQAGATGRAAGYLAASVGLGLAAVWVGVAAAKGLEQL